MVFGFRARRAETDLREELAKLQLQRVQQWMSREDQLRDVQYQTEAALLRRAKEALDADNLDLFNSLSSQALMTDKRNLAADNEILASPVVSLGPNDTLAPHERFLDKWRIVITLVTVVALFTVVMLILFTGTSAASASPYVSLLSGLAGIALGWMFAGGGLSSAGAKRRTAKAASPSASARANGESGSSNQGDSSGSPSA